MSTHRLPVITITPDMKSVHTNADSLELITIKGWQVVAKKGAFPDFSSAVYIEPDFMVPTSRACFAFLANGSRTHHRVRTIRLRKEISFGLLVPLSEFEASYPEMVNSPELVGGQDDEGIYFLPGPFEIERFEEKVQTQGHYDLVPGPKIWVPKFDLESYQNYPNRILPGEQVVITEKIHGTNSRFVFSEDKFYIGSRARWIAPDQNTTWNKILEVVPGIEQWCRRFPDTVLIGEIYGNVQSLKYGTTLAFAAFSAVHQGNYHSVFGGDSIELSLMTYDVATAPILYQGPFDISIARRLAEEDSSVLTAPKGHMREGVVITPFEERVDKAGRVALKLISNRYWEQK